MNEIIYDVSSHEAAPAALKTHKKMLEVVLRLQPDSVLEVGAGIGLLGKQIADAGIRYVGVEPETAQFRISRERFLDVNIINASCYDDPQKLGLGRFDLVISNDVIEHLYLPRRLVQFEKAHLAPGGKVVTCTPDFGSYWKNIAYSFLNKWDAVHDPHWDGGHIKFFSRKSLQRMFTEEGFDNFEWDSVRNLRYPIFPMSIVCICSHNESVKH